MEWLNGRIPRFHPLIAKHDGVMAWWICDGHADTEHHLPVPYVEIEEPCASHEEAEALSAILNEENEDS